MIDYTTALTLVRTALSESHVRHHPNHQTRRALSLSVLPDAAERRIVVVRGGYQDQDRDVVLGYTNSRLHGHRIYTVVARKD